MNDSLKEKIVTLYGVSEILGSERITQGVLSENHALITNTGKYFLKKYRFDIEARIKEIHAAKQYFAEAGIPVILPFITNEQKTYFSLENNFYALFPFIEARQLSGAQLSDTAIISMGEMLGRIHLAGKESKLSIHLDVFKPWDKENFNQMVEEILKQINDISRHSDFDVQAVELLNLKKRR